MCTNRVLHILLLVVILVTGNSPELNAANSEVRFATIANQSDSGHVTLEWTSGSQRHLVIEMSLFADFRTIRILERGTKNTLFVSGLANGNYYFRLKSSYGEVLDTHQLQVQHHSYGIAFFLFGVGKTS